MNKLKPVLKIVKNIVYFLYVIIKFVFKIIPIVLIKLFEKLNRRLRFSISLKITAFYALIFSIIFFLISGITAELFNAHSMASSRSIPIVMFIFYAASLFVIITLGLKSTRKLLLPIEKMTNTVKEISINALDTRLDISDSQDELKDLSVTFNNMLNRIQNAYEQQNQFVSDASHELRTPISVIQGYANLLDRWGKNDKAVLDESVAAIKSEAQSMKDLVEKLLFLARSDKNTQKVEKEPFLVNELVDEIIKETRLIDLKHILLCEQNDPISINADRKLIKETIRIFLDNSIKYTPQNGLIKLNSHVGKKNIVITIEDNGVGIPKEDLPYVFNRFYRSDKSRTRKTGGSGLGLSIAKWIIGKHNGSIELESKVSVGTKITVCLPLQ